MSNKWNNIIREKLESHEVPADHLWNNISQNTPQTSSSFWKPWMTSAAIGTAAIATSAIIYFNSPKSLQPIAQTTEQKSEEVGLDTLSSSTQPVENSSSEVIPQIIVGGIPDDIISGYVWEFPEPDSTKAAEASIKRNSEIVATIDDTTISNLSENREVTVLAEKEELTNSFTAVVSNAESLRYFFFGATEKADSYVWNFGDGFDGQGQSIAHEFTEEGTYTVKYLVSRGEEVLVEEKTIEVYRPAKLSPVTAFAPGFDGKNDVFDVLYNARNISEVVNFEITDANGRKVYQSGGQSVWDGKNMNGELCQPAYYYWLIEFKDRQGNLKSQSGAIRIFAE
ncbi:MAG: gliding motility-associated C-terminal domain-containing protein [Flavobacteriales bacterium]|nr:gliding motility-associated C-terminal domain-containing protein [Flavobacteriales bacterium]